HHPQRRPAARPHPRRAGRRGRAMSKHTQGRLHVAGVGRTIRDGQERAICRMCADDADTLATAAPNARRLGACWNLCQGLDTAPLEGEPGYAELLRELDAAAGRAGRFDAARAELLTVLSQVEEYVERAAHRGEEDAAASLAAVRAIVARHKGEG